MSTKLTQGDRRDIADALLEVAPVGKAGREALIKSAGAKTEMADRFIRELNRRGLRIENAG